MLLLKREARVNRVSIEIEVEESCVVSLSGVKASSVVLETLEDSDLLWGNSIFAVDHHLG